MPTYSLDTLKAIFNCPANLVMTVLAVRGYTALGFTQSDVVAAIQALTSDDFFKTMEPYTEGFTAWQDVYKPIYNGIGLYIKFQKNPETGETIISFKER
ncbi:type II toxin-antitoxin system MqsR family toxin [Piscirickettsia litoralis]|uniref:Type II toxin-antitoxin system MqsR family toxin n=1 Tax=Piscirickettsia litoralis TaxID=1891921 RepID=A0ABX2ZXS0_9GAMM|nr:type II toxin-antitoxin system MqsR family toxin [Piscirickettsia litoralis]ODN41404.1 hypothetical protein BGC07_16700 [Piscirickettsia litoralis]